MQNVSNESKICYAVNKEKPTEKLKRRFSKAENRRHFAKD